jgi:hypothetical protein
VTIPDNVNNIGYGAFTGCTNLTSVTIPNGITAIEGGVFSDCTSLTSVTIPNNITSIGRFAFVSTNLASITIPSSVTSIDIMAFSYCTSLISVTFQGTIPSSSFGTSTSYPFDGDLHAKFYATDKANGTPGTYTRSGSTWTKQ